MRQTRLAVKNYSKYRILGAIPSCILTYAHHRYVAVFASHLVVENFARFLERSTRREIRSLESGYLEFGVDTSPHSQPN